MLISLRVLEILVMIKDNKGFTSVLIGMRSLLISTGNEVLVGEPIAKFPQRCKVNFILS